jgi:predicted Rossmann fold nucleotide-binding protein DprA/Smf involved in DNA uptake
MKWIGITGTWGQSCPELEKDLDREVNKLLREGNGIVSGGALGVDYRATELALAHAPDGSRVKIFLPTPLSVYAAHYRKRAEEKVITHVQAETLIRQLETAEKLGSLIADTTHTEVTKETYYLRNTAVMSASDEVLAFQINASAGTQDTIDKAYLRTIPVNVFNYTVL